MNMEALLKPLYILKAIVCPAINLINLDLMCFCTLRMYSDFLETTSFNAFNDMS